MSKIDSGKVIIKDLFTRFWLRVPDYQRAYVWEQDEISKLIDDVNYASVHNDRGEYFLGSMVLRKAVRTADRVTFEEYELLDGQQRLTTLMLMLACIRDRVDDADLKNTCNGMLFQREDLWHNIPGRTRLVYDIRDNVGNFIERYIKVDAGSCSPDLKGIAADKNLSLARMSAGMQTIHAEFNDSERFPTNNDFERFVRYLMNNVIFIYVATENLEDAFRLFTIVNGRGKKLSFSDVLKAKNLGAVVAERDRSRWAVYWEEIEGEMGEDDFNRFLSLVRSIYVKDKAREEINKEFDDRIYGANPPLLALGIPTFEAVKTYKDAYYKIIKLIDLPIALGNSYRNRINVMSKGLPSTDWIPPVLAWYRKFGTTDLLTFIERIDNKFSADWIIQLTPTHRIKNMNEVLKVIERSDTTNVVLEAPVFSIDNTQLENLLTTEIYGRSFAKYVLLRLEYLLATHAAQLNLPDEISVEHILPQTPAQDSQWRIDFTDSQREDWQHRLGNLMLLSRRKNTSLSNLDFVNKKERYFHERVESLPNSQRLLATNSFAFDDMTSRHNDLLEKLLLSYR